MAQKTELAKISGSQRFKNQSVDIQMGTKSLPYAEGLSVVNNMS